MQHDDAPERDEQRVHRASPCCEADREEHDREQHGHADDEQPVRRGTAVTPEVERPGEVGRVEEPDEAEREDRERPRAASSPLRRSGAEPVDQRSADREHARDHEHRRHRRTDLAVAEQAVVVRVHEERDPARERVRRVGGLHLTAFHRLRPVEPVEVQDRRRDVDHVDEAVLARRRGAQQAGREPGARTATGVSDGRCVGGTGPTTMTASRFGSTSSSSRPTSVSVSRSARVRSRARCSSDAKRPARSARTRSDPSTSTTARPVHAWRNASSTWSGSSRTPNGAPGSAWRRSRSTRPPGTFPCVGHQRRDRTPPVRRHPVLGRARVGAVAVGDHGPCDAGLRQLVAEQPDLRAVELAVVLVDHVVDRHVHEAVGRAGCPCGSRNTRPARSRPKFSSTPKPWPAVCPAGRRARARTERHVVAADRAGADDAVGDQPTDRRCGEQPVEVRAGRRPAGRTTRRSGARSRGHARDAARRSRLPVAPCAGRRER